MTHTNTLDEKPVGAAVDRLELELDGTVFLVEKKHDGTVLNKESLDGDLVLRALAAFLQGAVEAVIHKEEEK